MRFMQPAFRTVSVALRDDHLETMTPFVRITHLRDIRNPTRMTKWLALKPPTVFPQMIPKKVLPAGKWFLISCSHSIWRGKAHRMIGGHGGNSCCRISA